MKIITYCINSLITGSLMFMGGMVGLALFAELAMPHMLPSNKLPVRHLEMSASSLKSAMLTIPDLGYNSATDALQTAAGFNIYQGN